MLKDFFKELFEYNLHYNKKLAKSFLANHGIISSESEKLFSHIINAHEIWISRIQGKPQKYKVWDIHKVIEYEEIIEKIQEKTNYVLETCSFNELIPFPKGKSQKRISDVLFHIINHSTYHRGQIAMDFRINGIEPIATDYIIYKKGHDLKFR